MAETLRQNPGDVLIQLSKDEAAALFALLYEIQDKKVLKEIVEEHSFEISEAQTKRISELWEGLVAKNPR